VSLLAYARGVAAARRLYSVKVALETPDPADAYAPAQLERRPDDDQRVADQVDMLFTRFPQFDADSHFPMPGTTVPGGP
jgi:hypothetical protein